MPCRLRERGALPGPVRAELGVAMRRESGSRRLARRWRASLRRLADALPSMADLRERERWRVRQATEVNGRCFG